MARHEIRSATASGVFRLRPNYRPIQSDTAADCGGNKGDLYRLASSRLGDSLHPPRPPRWSLKRWCEVRDLVSDLAITKMEDVDGVPYAPVGVADPGLANVGVAGTGDLEGRSSSGL